MFDEGFWEGRYRDSPAVWSGRANPQLVAEAGELRAGTALDVGCGEGADAIWLAARGWHVTAVDFAATALRRAAGHADALGADLAARIRWLPADVTAWSPATAAYDLVSAQFMHLPSGPREALFTRLATAVAPGGTLLLVGHHPRDLSTTMPRPAMPELFFTAEQVADTLDPAHWDAVDASTRPRPARDPDGRDVTIHDAVLRAHRRAAPGPATPGR